MLLLTEKQINGLVRFITAGIDGVSDMITASKKGAEFPLSPIQKGHMSKGSDHSGFITTDR